MNVMESKDGDTHQITYQSPTSQSHARGSPEQSSKAPRNRTYPKTSGPRHSKLTLRQRQFIHEKLQGKSSAAAARTAEYSQSVARKADEIIGGSLHVQTAMAEILHAAGITDELLAERIWQGLNATIVSKKTAYAAREVLIDFKERREMTELVLRFKGHLVHKHEIGGPGGAPIFPKRSPSALNLSNPNQTS